MDKTAKAALEAVRFAARCSDTDTAPSSARDLVRALVELYGAHVERWVDQAFSADASCRRESSRPASA